MTCITARCLECGDEFQTPMPEDYQTKHEPYWGRCPYCQWIDLVVEILPLDYALDYGHEPESIYLGRISHHLAVMV